MVSHKRSSKSSSKKRTGKSRKSSGRSSKRSRDMVTYRPVPQQSCVEKKYLDTDTFCNVFRSGSFLPAKTPNATGASSGENVGFFMGISSGAGFNQRIGNKICVKNINFNGVIKCQPSVDASNFQIGKQSIRMLLVLDKQCSGFDPTVEMILGLTTTAAQNVSVLNPSWSSVVPYGAASAYFKFRNMENVGRFVILKEKKYTFEPQWELNGADAVSAYAAVPIKLSWKGSMDVHYADGVGGAITVVKSNNVFALFISSNDQDNSGSTSVNVYGTCRVKYTDY